jgi:hypothetical protein
MRLGLRVAALLTLLAGVVVTSPTAAIQSVSGEVHGAAPPASVALNQHEHADSGQGAGPFGAHAFDEEQDYVAKAPILLDVCTTTTSPFVICPDPKSGNIDRPSSLSPGTIPAGACIDSHFVHADPPGSTGPVLVYGALTGQQQASVTFDSMILGVVILSGSLALSDFDPGLGPSPVMYGGEAQRGLELNQQGNLDGIRLELAQNRIVFLFRAGTVDLDQIRVITIGDPDDCPGQAKTMTLTPVAAENQVGTTHCVVATVQTETGGPAQGVIVRFDVEGASEQDTSPPDEDASKTTDQDGIAQHCYSGPETVGADTIHAYADNDKDGVEDILTDPSADATKTWLPAAANSITLDPKADENPVGTQHCVTATVRDLFLNPVPNKKVRFVVTGTTTKAGVDQTDANGVAEFCYSSTASGSDVITAFVDADNDNEQDPGEIFDLAAKVWQPGQPAMLELTPDLAENDVNTQHCVFALVLDAFGNPVPNITVRFEVTGTNTKTGSDTTDTAGQADFCYAGGTTAGPDLIAAYADSDKDGTQDADEPGDVATKIWLPLEPAFLTLTPKTAENVVNTQHCLQAHVTDIFLNPNPDILVRFSITGTTTKNETRTTNSGGIAEFCYTSTKSGLDMIHAYADTDEDNVQDPEEPFDDATKLWQPGDPFTLVLTPKTSENEVGTQHCVKAEVKDAFGNPTPHELVRFDVEGASEQDQDPADEDGSDTTDEFGNATHCYTGPDLPGEDTIHAYADNDEDNVEDADEPARDNAAKTWVLPPSTPGCEIKLNTGGWIYTLTGSKGTFGGNARIELDGTIRGQLEYQDHSALTPVTFHSTDVLVIVCDEDRKRAQIYGLGNVNGLGPLFYRITVRDLDEPGSQPGLDTYQFITTAYASGAENNPLEGGNIHIHVFA